MMPTEKNRNPYSHKVKAKKDQLKIPLPSFQGSIALKLTASIEEGGAPELFPPANQPEERLSAAQPQAGALTHSFLDRSFSGRIFALDPNDAPASALLEHAA